MLTKNLTSFLVGTKVGSRKPPNPDLVVVVRGKFTLQKDAPVAELDLDDQGALSEERFAEDDEERKGEPLYPGDFADSKVGAEVLLMGKCHTPNQKPLTECGVVFRVGTFQKSLRIVGDRQFTDKLFGSSTTEPTPFTEMPLTWARAFGGAEYDKNPIGTGHKNKTAPNILYPSDTAGARPTSGAPASFGPIPSGWAERVRRRGKEYGPKWQATRAPFYAEDTDPRVFSAAPSDQWLSEPLTGEEEVFLQNLHPAHALFSTRLPGLRVRTFCRLKKGDFVEAKMALDTLLVEPEEGTLTLTWRGHVAVSTLDLSDVSSLLIAAERLADPKADTAPYKRLLSEVEANPIGIHNKWSPGFADAVERYQREQRGEPPAPDPGAEGLDPITALLRQKLGGLIANDQKQIAESIKTAKANAGDKLDLSAEAQKVERQLADAPPPTRAVKPGVAPNIGLRRQMRNLLQTAAQLKEALSAGNIPDEQKKPAEERVAELEKVPFDPRWQKLDPYYTPPIEPLTTHDPGPALDLRDRDFTGVDLSGKNLAGANFEGAILTRANLSGANLTGANLRNTILFRANLDRTVLTGANLTRTNASRATAAAAVFDGANVEQASFAEGVFTGASFAGVRGEFASFERTDLTSSTWENAELSFSDFSDSTLSGASFKAVSFRSVRFINAKGDNVSFESARIPTVSFQQANLPNVNYTNAVGERLVLADSVLDGANFSYAVMHDLFGDGASLVGANCYGADLRRARCRRSKLERADLSFSNLFMADLSDAAVDGARFVQASLYGACLLGTNGKGADLRGANLKRSSLEQA
ncbi:MAG: DUF2169 domain-containing protein [Polyangiaceae bacterium]|nr:DUF2169 domain-containing protein [Polyangiaceae bacterium]